jgi:hypothetical protein
MSSVPIIRRRLRANPRFRLAAFDELEPVDQRSLGDLKRDPDVYGMLLPPPGSGLPAKAVSSDAALLIHTLREPRAVPHLLERLFSADAEAQVTQLVFDGVLEVESGGRFISGERAVEVHSVDVADTSCPVITALSRAAIAYGAELTRFRVPDVASRLYLFNRAPSTPALQRRFADATATLSYVIGHADYATSLGAWTLASPDPYWLRWERAGGGPSLPYKLYVSPVLDDLPKMFGLTVRRLASTGCQRFKLGCGAYGLLRPDKLVAYFETLEELHAAADSILATVRPARAHGVPFSAAIDDGGFVSWGMDPPQLWAAEGIQSWRQWVVERVAAYTVAAQVAASEDTINYVLRRIALDGVDVRTWTPGSAMWRSAAVRPEEAT